MISYVIPTKDRPARLAATLEAIGRLPAHRGEVVVVDNASSVGEVAGGCELANGVVVRVLRMSRNMGAAARNEGARASDPSSEWLVMLDDDSYPVGVPGCVEAGGLGGLLSEQPGEVFAVAGEIFLPARGVRESGGLPEVFIGCGAAVRRDVFLDVGGYDESFDYYAEEYDLCARLLLAGGRVRLDRRFKVEHHKVEEGRDFNRIVHRLVRNNGWVMRRYAPERLRSAALRETVERYGRIAAKEDARWGYACGVEELSRTAFGQPMRTMSDGLWERFTGVEEARRSIGLAWRDRRFSSAVLGFCGKGEVEIRRVLREFGVRVVENAEDAEAVVVGTLSPGPMLDAFERLCAIGDGGEAGRFAGLRVVVPWRGLVDPTVPVAGGLRLSAGAVG